ncbi:hypothetical protein AB0F13_21140 [Streptomyces sp. NPDC026206]|uniref:hypothetical protein n=1 Tax=Streptomyces sp. NPDC026206 TaxID=3157089 RepID=UPI0033F34B04
MPWEQADRFTVGAVDRPATLRRKAVTGPRAVRVPCGSQLKRFFAPSALVLPADASAPPSAAGFRLDQDGTAGHLICSVDAPQDGNGERRYRVRDDRGEEIGSVCRGQVQKRLVQHPWRIEQPGLPPVVARYHWAKGTPKEIIERGVGNVLGSVADSLLSFGAEGGDSSPRPVTWRAAGTAVMTCEWGDDYGYKAYTLLSAILDRRLAFALAVLRDE